jgi:Predicted membrane protein
VRYVFLVLMCIFAGIYAAIKYKGGLAARVTVKAIASVSFIMIAFAGRIDAYQPYYTLIMAGLCFSLAGDVLLVFADKRTFIAGCIAFMLAHAGYISAFFIYAAPAWYDAALFFAFAAIGAAAFAGKRLQMGPLKTLIFVYAAVLSAMAAKAVSMLLAGGASTRCAAFAALGGALFALSDIMLAHAHFHTEEKRTVGVMNVVFYYAAQALIALSVAL